MKIPLGIIASVLPIWAAFAPVQSPQAIRTFLGGSGCVLVWSEVSSSGTGSIWYADLTAGTAPKKICDGAFPRVSADATHLLYLDPSGAICIRSCIAGSPDADRRFINDVGRSPAWWVRPSDNVPFVTYTVGSGELWCQKLDKGYRPDGAATLLYSSPPATFFTYTGRSSDGRYFATREDGAGMWEISPAYASAGPISYAFVTYTGNGSSVIEGFCHGDCSPAGSAASPFYGCLIHFYMGAHEAFYVRRFNTQGRTSGATDVGMVGITDSNDVVARIAAPPVWGDTTYTAWDEIRWTSHPGFIAAGALHTTEGRSDLFLVKPADSSMLRLGFGIGTGYSVWIDTNAVEPLASLPVATTLRGKAPFAAHFDGTASTGPSLSYRWNFGDGATALTATADHVYVHPGEYRAWLVVANGTGADSSYLPIIVDSIDAAASRLVLYPGPNVTVDRGSSVYFDARAIDSNGNDLPIDSAVWSMHGSSGGSVSVQGVYSAGRSSGADTVRVSLNLLSASCVVTVAAGTALGFSAPSAGTTVLVGETLGIVLSVDTTRVRKALLYYSGDAGRTLSLITRTGSLTLDRSIFSFEWQVPPTLGTDSTPSDSAMIIAADYDGIQPSASSPLFRVAGLSRVINPDATGRTRTLRPVIRMNRMSATVPAGASVILHDALGRTLDSRSNTSSRAVSIYLSLPRAGVYFLSLDSGGKRQVFRLIIE